ncbi:MAG: serine protease [Rhodospirillaceae bacterium]|nr:serine protease [Rhodospirillaceae bacterium]
MSDLGDWEFPEPLRPKSEGWAFDVDTALDAVVSLTAEIPEDAFTASILGTERTGNGVLIDGNGLVLTIGYLVTEAERIWLGQNSGKVVPAHLVAYDFDTGFGLVQALAPLDAKPLPFGRCRDLAVGSSVIVAGAGGRRRALEAKIVGKREFAGYWEYVIDEAIFTTPAHPHWGGTGLLGTDGKLYGVGSLYVQHSRGGDTKAEGNMIVPIDPLPPILDSLTKTGTSGQPPRPWLGFYATEAEERLLVVGLAPQGPADKAGVRPGDIVIDVAGAPVGNLADLWRTVWTYGKAGCEMPMTFLREGKARRCTIKTADRSSFLKSPRLH